MARRFLKLCVDQGSRRSLAFSACAASAVFGTSGLCRKDSDGLRRHRLLPCDAARPQKSPLRCADVEPSSRPVFANDRIRVTEIQLQPDMSTSACFEFPHLRWKVLPPGCTQTPKPTFHSAGESHTMRSSAQAGHREFIFEFLCPPKYTDLEFKRRQAAAWYHGMPGSEFMFENEYCVAYDFRVPARGGDKHDMHQHTVDHFFVVLDLPCRLDVYVPETDADLPAADRRVHNVRHIGTLDCPDVATSWRYFAEAGNGGFVDGKPKLGPAVHGVCNPNAQEFREYYIDLK
eukprot:TRINITY_DN34298_c0_g1_i1.p1 TRINITY_DN34298_c0_g1~~TRINITY_DN34298_c0_g1_i1.p1  ORF type:complete len:308 (-),score=30.98 TRINITY_DN34298_c0_g1_i1:112-978(-)